MISSGATLASRLVSLAGRLSRLPTNLLHAGLYFAWLGFYTLALIVPSIFGLVVFIAGVGSLNDQQVDARGIKALALSLTACWLQDVNDLCAADNVTRCATCNNGCERWFLSDSCGGYKVRLCSLAPKPCRASSVSPLVCLHL